MAVTREQVLNYLGREEPPYRAAAGLGTGALPHLLAIAKGPDLGLAAKAVSLAGHIAGGADVVKVGIRHKNMAVRVSAAAAIQHLDRVPADLARRALSDPAPQVRKWGLRSAAARPAASLKPDLERIAKEDPDEMLRSNAQRLLERG